MKTVRIGPVQRTKGETLNSVDFTRSKGSYDDQQ